MKVIILGGSNSRNSGGVFNSARMLGLNLYKHYQTDVHFLMHDDEYSQADRKFYSPLVPHSYKIIGPPNLGFSLDIYDQISQLNPDIVHTQSLWMYLSYANLKYFKKTNTPYVISPRGMMDVWSLSRSKLKKSIVLSLYEREHLQNAACLHALCKEEMEAMRAFGLKNPIALIPNGVDIPTSIDTSISAPWTKRADEKVVLFLSRIHQKKGIENLLKAWAKLPQNQWKLVIAGETKDVKYQESLYTLRDELSIGNSVEFIGGQFGKDKAACLTHADAFILPSFSEGLPMAVLEAWSYKLPVVITPACNIEEGFLYNAAIKIEPEVLSITKGLEELFEKSEQELQIIGENGYTLVEEKFTWQKVSGSLHQLYNWILNKNEKPDFVYLD